MTASHSRRRHTDHIVFIGGGGANALTAARLAERGYQVTVLEKARIGNGSSSRSAAGIRAQWGVRETAIGMLYSEWFYAHFHDLLQTPESERTWMLKQNGYLFLYEDPDHSAAPWQWHARQAATAMWELAQQNVVMQRSAGIAVDLLTPQDVHQRWPHILPDRLIGATWGPHDGFLNHDVIYQRGFARAQELGAEVRQNTEVIGAQTRGERITGLVVATNGAHDLIEGDWFVNGAGAWAPRVSARLHGMPLNITPLKRYLYFLKPSRPIMDVGAWSKLPMTIYGMGSHRGAHSRPDGQSLLIGWAHSAAPEPDFTDADQDVIHPEFHHAHGVENYGYRALTEIEEFAPQLANCGGLHATTCGYYEATPDASPLIGYDANWRNLVHAAGFSGHGLMHAPITAVLVEAIISGAVATSLTTATYSAPESPRNPDALVAGELRVTTTTEVKHGLVHLPEPFADHTIDLAAFDPGRDFTRSQQESQVL